MSEPITGRTPSLAEQRWHRMDRELNALHEPVASAADCKDCASLNPHAPGRVPSLDDDEIKPWDDDHTALVHVLWRCSREGLTIKDDFDEVASRIRQSKYHRAVVVTAFRAGRGQGQP